MPIKQCSRHAPHPTWTSATGERCPICGVSLDDRPVPSEPPVVRSLAFYQRHAGSTSSQAGTRTPSRLCMAVVGLCGEAGEFLDAMKKREFAGHGDLEVAAKELGDVAWHAAEAATALGISLEELATESLDRAWGPLIQTDVELPCSRELLAALELFERANATMVFAALSRFEPRPETVEARSIGDALAQTFRAIARAANACELDLEAVATANIGKLWARYHGGKFSTTASQARVDVREPAP